MIRPILRLYRWGCGQFATPHTPKKRWHDWSWWYCRWLKIPTEPTHQPEKVSNQVTNHRLNYPRAEWLPDSINSWRSEAKRIWLGKQNGFELNCSGWKELSQPKKPWYLHIALKKTCTWYSDTWSSNIQPKRIYRSEHREIHTSVFRPWFHWCFQDLPSPQQLRWIFRFRPFRLSNWFDIVALLASHLDHSHHSLRVWNIGSQHVARSPSLYGNVLNLLIKERFSTNSQQDDDGVLQPGNEVLRSAKSSSQTSTWAAHFPPSNVEGASMDGFSCSIN